MSTNDQALYILVHGPAGAGKTTFASTAPKPILLMDAERAARFIDLRRVYWDPMREEPPVYDGTWDMCVVKTNQWEKAQKALEYLRGGRHPFRSVMIDSLSEMQIKAQEAINGRNQMQTQHWGKLLQNMGSFIRDLRDLLEEDDGSALQIVAVISTSKDYDGTFKPYLQGSIASQVPYVFDIVGYLYVNQVTSNTGEVSEHRYLFTGNHPAYEAKSRVKGLPPTIEDPHLEGIFNGIFNIQSPIAQAPQESLPQPTIDLQATQSANGVELPNM
jgi:hypothetical protein